MSKYLFSKKEVLTIQTIFFLFAVFLTFLPQSTAVKLPTISVTLTSPNPLAYVIGSGVASGMYGATVACGGDYIFVHGEGNFYVYNAKAKVLIKTLVGQTIATGNGYVAIGNPDSTGKVDIYRLNNLNRIVATLSAPENSHVGFGLAIAISNDKMLISDIGSYSGDVPYSGDVYVYSVPSFSYITKLEQQNPERAYGSPFGKSLAFSGDRIIVGAPDQTVNGAMYAGNVYFYNSITYALEETISDPQADATAKPWGQFGRSLAVSGDYIWISEPGFNYPGIGDSGDVEGAGKVYCYNTQGEQVTTLMTPNPAYLGFFGCSLGADDDYIVVGASGESVDIISGGKTSTVPYAGQVYVFTSTGTYIKTLTSLYPQIFGSFGNSVALGQGFTVVGAPEENATVRCKSTFQNFFEAGCTYILS